MSTALGVSADQDNNGCTPLDHRMIIGSNYLNCGIKNGLGVKGRSDLRYQVDAGVAVTSRGDADGKMEAYFEGGSTPETTANTSVNPRIDAIWLMAHNRPEHKDDDNQVIVSVTQGTPASTPTKPNLPAGVTVLAYMLLPAGATSTANATRAGEVDYAVPYGSALGLIGTQQVRQNMTIDATYRTHCKMSVNLPTDRWLRFDLTVCASAHGANGGGDLSKMCEVGGHFRIDGTNVDELFNLPFIGGSWHPQKAGATVFCGRGIHTLEVELHKGYGVDADVHYGSGWPGIKLCVFDEGLKQ